MSKQRLNDDILMTEGATVGDVARLIEDHPGLVHPDAKISRAIGSIIAAVRSGKTVGELNVDLAEIAGPLERRERQLAFQEIELISQLAELAELRSGMESERDRFFELVPEFREKWAEVQRRAKLVPVPPSTKTPANLEASLMATAYAMEPMTHFGKFPDSEQEDARNAAFMMVGHLARNSPDLQPLISRSRLLFESVADVAMRDSHVFGSKWLRSGFARLEISHKLAAALALTDVPDDIEIRAPWEAWSLIVPPGIFPAEGDTQNDVARVWCIGSEPKFLVFHNGVVAGPINNRDEIYREYRGIEGGARAALESSRILAIAVDCLVRGCCLALANPDEHKKHTMGGSKSAKNKRTTGLPDFGSTRFMLSTPVTVDLREHLHEYLGGKRHGGGAPKVQFMVRGHWKNQAHGPRHSLRKQIWIQPFWKGSEEARVLLRNYTVKDE